MPEAIELTRLERLIIWMRRNRINFSWMGASLGITRMSAGWLCKAERIPRELLPPVEVLRSDHESQCEY